MTSLSVDLNVEDRNVHIRNLSAFRSPSENGSVAVGTVIFLRRGKLHTSPGVLDVPFSIQSSVHRKPIDAGKVHERGTARNGDQYGWGEHTDVHTAPRHRLLNVSFALIGDDLNVRLHEKVRRTTSLDEQLAFSSLSQHPKVPGHHGIQTTSASPK